MLLQRPGSKLKSQTTRREVDKIAQIDYKLAAIPEISCGGSTP
jgi:hypothetical protein